LREDGKNERKLLFTFCLSTKNSACLFGFTSPLAVSMKLRAAGHLLHLFVGVLVRALAKVVESIPQRSDHRIDDLSREVKQAERICLQFIRKTQRIAQGPLITVCAHFKSSFCLCERMLYNRPERQAMRVSKSSESSCSGVWSSPSSFTENGARRPHCTSCMGSLTMLLHSSLRPTPF